MRNPHDIVVRALMSEKGARQREQDNQYLFEVNPTANKIEIKRAVEAIFSVSVAGVRTMVVRGKRKRMGMHSGMRPNWKKAIVTLKQGDTIDLFDQV
jgi:large subunit ribosomal protein L23